MEKKPGVGRCGDVDVFWRGNLHAKPTTLTGATNARHTHRLRVVFKHFSGLFLGAPLLHALSLQVSLLRLLENLIRSPVSAQKLVRLLRGQRNYRKTPREYIN